VEEAAPGSAIGTVDVRERPHRRSGEEERQHRAASLDRARHAVEGREPLDPGRQPVAGCLELRVGAAVAGGENLERGGAGGDRDRIA
jgi:hypothetical protein